MLMQHFSELVHTLGGCKSIAFETGFCIFVTATALTLPSSATTLDR